MTRVEVRRVEPGDAGELATFADRNRIFHGEGFSVPRSVEAWRRLAADRANRWYRVVSGPALVGVLWVGRLSGPPWFTAEFGAGADQPSTGRGLVSQGVRQMLEIEFATAGVERMEALIRPGHVESERLVTAAGFEEEGIVRRAVRRGGVRVDMVRWAYA